MATVAVLEDAALGAEAAAVFDDIRRTRGTEFVGAFWRALAHDPPQLARVWAEAKAAMAPGALDALTKELVYVAVSTANGCGYCVHSHTAAARAKGMTPAQHAELLAVIALAARTNALATALGTAVDREFEMGAAAS
jgi:AhpD family alkylhydroperoxidase